MKIESISMKSNGTYYRMKVRANELPSWVYFKALDIDNDDYGYLDTRDKQCFEIEGYIINDKATDLRIVYFWENYETITELDRSDCENVYEAFEDFARKYGNKMPDNGELCLGDEEYTDMISQELKEEWACEKESETTSVWDFFVMDYDGTYDNEDDDSSGVEPTIYMVPQNKLAEVCKLATLASDMFAKNVEYDVCIGDYFEQMLEDKGILFKNIGNIPLSFEERKTDYLAEHICKQIV